MIHIHPKLVAALDAYVGLHGYSCDIAPRLDAVVTIGRTNLQSLEQEPQPSRPFYEGLPKYRRKHFRK